MHEFESFCFIKPFTSYFQSFAAGVYQFIDAQPLIDISLCNTDHETQITIMYFRECLFVAFLVSFDKE